MGGPWITGNGEVARDTGHAFAQLAAGFQSQLDAMVSCLVHSGAINPAELIERIGIAHRDLPAGQTGPISRSIAQAVVKALVAQNCAIEEAPDWMKALIVELEPMKAKE